MYSDVAAKNGKFIFGLAQLKIRAVASNVCSRYSWSLELRQADIFLLRLGGTHALLWTTTTFVNTF